MTGRALLWTSEQAACATRGIACGRWASTGVSIDTRTLQPGDLFVALQGPRFDGHQFVGEALGKDAAAALVARRPEGIAPDAPLLLVDDTFLAMQALATAARERSTARIAGVTGSVGKTGVKEALRLVLGGQGQTHASDGSLNNHWGVPLSLARLPPSAAFGVFEMGMNHPGEITPLTRQVRPHAAIITTVEAVHIENFASEDQIADAKAEIFLGMEPDGTAVLNRDNRHFARLAKAARAQGVGRVLSFGSMDDADACLLAADGDAAGTTVQARVCGREFKFRVGVAGAHWVMNALGVLLVVEALEADLRAAADALADLRPPKGRGHRSTVALTTGSVELIDDSYNASPPSMRASIDVLGGCRVEPGGRRIAVLGDMLELGSAAPHLHAALAQPLQANRIDLVFTAGPMMTHLHEALPACMRGAHAPESKALAPLVAEAVRAGDVVVVKGSAGSRMRLVVDALLALDAQAQVPPPATKSGRAA